MYQQTPNGPVSTPYWRNQFRVGASLRGFPSLKGEEPRHPAVGALFIGVSPYTPHRLVHKWRLIIPAQVSSHPKP